MFKEKGKTYSIPLYTFVETNGLFNLVPSSDFHVLSQLIQNTLVNTSKPIPPSPIEDPVSNLKIEYQNSLGGYIPLSTYGRFINSPNQKLYSYFVDRGQLILPTGTVTIGNDTDSKDFQKAVENWNGAVVSGENYESLGTLTNVTLTVDIIIEDGDFTDNDTLSYFYIYNGGLSPPYPFSIPPDVKTNTGFFFNLNNGAETQIKTKILIKNIAYFSLYVILSVGRTGKFKLTAEY